MIWHSICSKNYVSSIASFLLWFFVGFTAYYALFSWHRIVSTGAPDFSVFYGAARRLWEGQSLSGDTGLYTGFGYPHATLLLFLPLLVLPYQMAQGVWVTASLALLPAIVWITMRLIGKVGFRNLLIWTSVMFWSFPTRWTLGMGQVNIVSLLFFLLSVAFLQSRRVWRASFFIVLLLLSKPHFGLFLPYLFVIGRWKEPLISVLLYSLTTFATVVVFGVEHIQSYLFHEIPILMAFEGRDIYYNQSFSAFFSRIASQDMAQTATIVSSVCVFVLSLFFARKQNHIVDIATLFLPVFLLVEPLGWQHHHVFLLPACLWLWYCGKYRLVLFLSFILISWNIKQPDATSNPLLLSHGFFGVMIFLCLALILNREERSARKTL